MKSAGLRLESLPTIVEPEAIADEDEDEDDILTLNAIADDEDEDELTADSMPPETIKRRSAVQAAFKGFSRNI